MRICPIFPTIKYGKGLPTNKLLSSGYKVYGGNGVIGYYKDYLYKNPQILVSCRGAASGKIIISDEESYVTSNSLVLELEDYDTFSFYKYYFLNNELYDYVSGSAQPQLTIDGLADLKVSYFDKNKYKDELKFLNALSNYECSLDKEFSSLLNIKTIMIEDI